MSTTRPTRLRFAGFLATVLGASLVALGCVLAWATVTIGEIGTANTFPPEDVKGLDTLEGKATIALGVLILVAIPAMRLTLSRSGRRAWASLIVIAGVVAGGLAIRDATRSFDRFAQSACDKVAGEISETTNLPFEPLLRRCEEQTAGRTQVDLKPGIYLVMAGGVLAVIGGALSFVWAGRPTKPGSADPLEEEPAAEGGPAS